MAEQFQFDTSGAVATVAGSDTALNHYMWDRLSPGVQGCIAAMLEEAKQNGLAIPVERPLAPEDEEWWTGDRDPGFSDLHPDTLARIIADWERFEAITKATPPDVFWVSRQRGLYTESLIKFPPLTPYLDDNGKVCLRAPLPVGED